MTADREHALARQLADLRRARRQQSGLAAELIPADSDAGYRVAGLVADELGWEVRGWKIAAFKSEMQRQLRTTAPIWGRTYFVHESPARFEHARLCSPIPEVEFQVMLGADLPARRSAYVLGDIDAAVASMHPGIELAECRFVHDDAFPPLSAILADGAGSGTFIYGPAIENWRQRDIAGQEARLIADGVVRRRGTAGAALGNPLEPILWLANELSRLGLGMKAGQIVSTGTLTGMLATRPEKNWTADFGPLGQVEIGFD